MAASLLEEGAYASVENAAARNRAGASRPGRGARYELPRLHRNRARHRGAPQGGSRPRDGSLPGLALCQVLRDKVPVDQMVEEGLDEIGPPVLKVQIIGVLPHVAGEQRGRAFGERVYRVGGARDLELAAVSDEPGPAAAELADGRRLEIILELGQAAEIAIDRLGHV